MNGEMNQKDLRAGKQSRPGGRAEKMLTVIYQATYELLQTMDYEKIEIPEIAQLAQVNKTTIYRRWPTKVELILEVALTKIKTEVPLPNTGNVFDDLTLFLKMIAFALQTPFTLNILKALLKNQDEYVQNARKSFWEERFLLAQPLVDRAIQRGELAATTHVREFFELAAAPIFYRILVTGDPVSDQDIELWAQRAILCFSKA